MLKYQQLVDVGLAPDVDALTAALEAAAHQLDFGIASGTLIRGRLGSGNALVRTFGNTPQAFISAFTSASLGQRDPLLTRMLAHEGLVTYDQAFYVAAGAADLWDFQAPYSYKNGIAFAMHEPGHAEVFSFGLDRDAALPADPVRAMLLQTQLQQLAVYAQDAVRRLLVPSAGSAPTPPLTKDEQQALQISARGVSVRKVGDLMVVGDADTRTLIDNAARKLGARSRSTAVLRAIQGGLIERDR